LAARVAYTVLDELDARGVYANAARMGESFRYQISAVMTALRREYTLRAVGLCMAIETNGPAFAQEVRRCAYRLGLRIRAIDRNVIVCPPLIITPQETEQLVDRLSRALAAAEQSRPVEEVGE
jgi:adenosylmethionine-8-amino-7-oxononanoate aminotransferase